MVRDEQFDEKKTGWLFMSKEFFPSLVELSLRSVDPAVERFVSGEYIVCRIQLERLNSNVTVRPPLFMSSSSSVDVLEFPRDILFLRSGLVGC